MRMSNVAKRKKGCQVRWAVLLLVLPACESPIEARAVVEVEVVAGANQTAVIGSVVGSPIVVRALDSDGNAVPSAPVFWSIARDGGQAGGRNGRIVSADSNTDSNGRAGSTVEVDSIPGIYRVTAFAGQYVDTAGTVQTAQAVVPITAILPSN